MNPSPERPDPSPPQGPNARTVALHATLSDLRSPLRLALHLPPGHRSRLRAVIERVGGSPIGDDHGLTAFFQDPRLAVDAARRLHREAALLALSHGDAAPLALRVALDMAADASDAARGTALSRVLALTQRARDHALLLTRPVHGALDDSQRERAQLLVFGEEVADRFDTDDLFELDWRAGLLLTSEATHAAKSSDPVAAIDRLELSSGSSYRVLTAADCPLTVGRDKSCGHPLDGDIASRVHGRIEYLHDKFYFIDESRNGTYLLTPQGEEIFLHHERLPLLGRGVISPGSPIVQQTGEVLRYACLSSSPQSAIEFSPTD